MLSFYSLVFEDIYLFKFNEWNLEKRVELKSKRKVVVDKITFIVDLHDFPSAE